jgi:uncharacterized membrane protein YfcA
MSTEIIIVLLAVSTLAFAGVVKGTVGVGFPVVAMSILTVFMEPIAALGLVAIPVLVTNGWQAFQANNYAAVFKRFWPLIATLVVGTWIGGLAVAQVDANILLGAIGAIALMFSVFSLLSPNLQISGDKEKWFGPITGMGTGIIGGLTAVHGPPVMMYLLALGLKKDEFVGTVGLIWFCGSIPMVIAYIYKGVLGPNEIGWSLLALIPVFLGLYFGELIRGKINQNVFKNILIAVLFVIGVNLIRRSLF